MRKVTWPWLRSRAPGCLLHSHRRGRPEPSLPPPVGLGPGPWLIPHLGSSPGSSVGRLPSPQTSIPAGAGTQAPDRALRLGGSRDTSGHSLVCGFLGLPAGAHPRGAQNAPLCTWSGQQEPWCPLHFPSTLGFCEAQAPSQSLVAPSFLSDPPSLHDELSLDPRPPFDLLHSLLPPAPGPESLYWPGWLEGNPSLGPLLYLWSLNLPGEPTPHPSLDRGYRPGGIEGRTVVVCPYSSLNQRARQGLVWSPAPPAPLPSP